MRIYACIATHNEAGTIGSLVMDLRRLGCRVLVADNCSGDGTMGEASGAGAHVFRMASTIGQAQLWMWRYAISNKADRVLQLDAGGSHDPNEAERLLASDADVVIGSRFLGEYNAPLSRRSRSWIASRIYSAYTGRNLTDWTSGYRAFQPWAAHRLAQRTYTWTQHAPWQASVVAEALLMRMNVEEVPITYWAGRSAARVGDALKLVKGALSYADLRNGA